MDIDFVQVYIYSYSKIFQQDPIHQISKQGVPPLLELVTGTNLESDADVKAKRGNVEISQPGLNQGSEL